MRIARLLRGPVVLLALLLPALLFQPPVAADSPAPGQDSPFGLVTCVAGCYPVYGELQRPIDAVAGTGAVWAREIFGWDRIEPADNAWDWGFSDEMVDKMSARGINVLGLLGYSVAWASGGSGSERTFSLPDLDAWAEYVYTVVDRYKGRVKHWEIWNEPNIAAFWQPQPSAEEYTRLLRASYAAAKRADPSAQVLLGGPSSVGQVKWLDELAAAGAWSAFDILAIHPYVLAQSLDRGWYDKDLREISAAATRYGVKPIWVTEIGWSSARGAPATGGLGTEERQANYLVRQSVKLLAWPGVQKIFVHSFRDAGDDAENPEAHFGLVRSDWVSPKQAFHAYRNMVQRLSGARFASMPRLGPGVTAYRFTRGDAVVDVIWTGGAARTVQVPGVSGATLYGLYGAAQPLVAAGGKLTFAAGADPVFLEH